MFFMGFLLSITAIFLILLVLVQRGRGGGLAGAFGGMGGQSAFGTKAGDTFTKITIGAAIFWLLLCIVSVKIVGMDKGKFGDTPAQTGSALPAGDDAAGTADPSATNSTTPEPVNPE